MPNEIPEARRRSVGLTVWLTGLSGAGKTTIAATVSTELERRGLVAVVLDGERVRERIGKDLGFTKSGRDESVQRIAYIAELLTSVGTIVLVSAVSPYRDGRSEVRQLLGNFIEVYVNAPLAVCRTRDPKGLYRRAATGDLLHLSGVDEPYEPPVHPDVECRTASETVAESTARVVNAITTWLSAHRAAVT
jgi:adenylylsulfate kinase